MSGFNPEDYRAPEMAPLSPVTVDGELPQWDLLNKEGGVVTIVNNVVVMLQDGVAYVDMVSVEVIDGDIKLAKYLAAVAKASSVAQGMCENKPAKRVFKKVPSMELPDDTEVWRECSCKGCGAPLSVRKSSMNEYRKVGGGIKGNCFQNFTDDELIRHYGISSETVGFVIYDDSMTCAGCHEY